jgi:hypothetical protein
MRLRLGHAAAEAEAVASDEYDSFSVAIMQPEVPCRPRGSGCSKRQCAHGHFRPGKPWSTMLVHVLGTNSENSGRSLRRRVPTATPFKRTPITKHYTTKRAGGYLLPSLFRPVYWFTFTIVWKKATSMCKLRYNGGHTVPLMNMEAPCSCPSPLRRDRSCYSRSISRGSSAHATERMPSTEGKRASWFRYSAQKTLPNLPKLALALHYSTAQPLRSHARPLRWHRP